MANKILTAGRSFRSYCKAFELCEDSLRNYKRILDIGSGLAGFVGACNIRGIDCTGVDARYHDIEALKQEFLNQKVSDKHSQFLKKNLEKLTGQKDLCIDSYKQDRVTAFEKYYAQFPQKFQPGNLFNLEYENQTFDLALCLELIATKKYFTPEQFIQGLQEMLRVSNEVRVSSGHFNDEIFNLPKFQELENDFDIERKRKLLIITRN